MSNIINPPYMSDEDLNILGLFKDKELKNIFEAADLCLYERSKESEKQFNSLILSLKRRFSASKNPKVLEKTEQSIVRKAANLAFSAKKKNKSITAKYISSKICDGYRTTISIPLAKLDKMMDFFTEGESFTVGRSGTTVEVTDIENGIMEPEDRKCLIPNYDLKLKITYKNTDGKDVTFRSEIQFTLEGTAELLKESRDAYEQHRDAENRIVTWTNIQKSAPYRKDACEEQISNCFIVKDKSKTTRLNAHKKIRDMLNLDGFKKQREDKLKARKQEKGTTTPTSP